MPELPEVENIRRNLEELVVGKTIEQVEVRLARIIRSPEDIRRFEFELTGCTITSIGRRGKYLLFSVPPYTLVSHLRMEGQYRFVKQDSEEQNHTHVVFRFTDGTELRYRDVRQFGTMDLVPEGAPFPSGLAALGPEPFDEMLTPKAFYIRVHARRAPIKAVLLDQTCVAGIGNIYADEALFEAKIHPATVAADLTKRQVDSLLKSIRDVLRRSIEAGGSTVKTFVDVHGNHGGFLTELKVYGREGQPCLVCGTEIEKSRLCGRGTHVCPSCQHLPRGATSVSKPSTLGDGPTGNSHEANSKPRTADAGTGTASAASAAKSKTKRGKRAEKSDNRRGAGRGSFAS